jgi:hypothetical protein
VVAVVDWSTLKGGFLHAAFVHELDRAHKDLLDDLRQNARSLLDPYLDA